MFGKRNTALAMVLSIRDVEKNEIMGRSALFRYSISYRKTSSSDQKRALLPYEATSV